MIRTQDQAQNEKQLTFKSKRLQPKSVWLTAAQPRSQGLSSLPPLVVGIETLVAAGHVTTQNLGGKKVCWAGGVAECFDCCGKLCGFQNLEQSLKTIRFIGI